MSQDEKLMFAQIIKIAAELYGKKLSEDLFIIYWELLKPYPLDVIKHALRLHAQNKEIGQFMPKPADLIRVITDNKSTRAKKAWAMVHVAIGAIGAYDSVQFSDPLIHVIIKEMGGWVSLCRQPEAFLMNYAKEFQQRYVYYVDEKIEHYPTHLMGTFERLNQGFNAHNAVPKFIGSNTEFVKLTYNNG